MHAFRVEKRKSSTIWERNCVKKGWPDGGDGGHVMDTRVLLLLGAQDFGLTETSWHIKQEAGVMEVVTSWEADGEDKVY
jgi:hypothetical protein